ncbi:MAG TPA: hypothetical protein VM261_14940 [Kofleriaceae bacterium]|nr:hypothetical protein [Kofleriaceae bacterium]
MPRPGIEDDDPEDPAQTLDDVGQIDVEPLDVDAMPAAERDEDLARAIAESKEGDLESIGEDDERSADTKDGSFEGAEEGENWLESLSRHAAEGGAAPAEELEVIDESDDAGGAQPSEGGDRPVADKGSGGPGGL